jgi:hypothetical protein
MAIKSGQPRDASDYQDSWRLVQAHPDEQRHVVDLPYRFCSPSAMSHAHAHVCFTHEDDLVGWAILQWEFWTLDHMVRPGPHATLVGRRILEWAIEGTGRAAVWRGEPLRLFVEVRQEGPPPALPLDDFGFTLYSDWRQLHLERPADLTPRQPSIPKGFTIRPLAG